MLGSLLVKLLASMLSSKLSMLLAFVVEKKKKFKENLWTQQQGILNMLIFEEKSLPSIRESKELLTVWFDYVIVWNHSEFVRTVVPCVSQDAVVTRRKKKEGMVFCLCPVFLLRCRRRLVGSSCCESNRTFRFLFEGLDTYQSKNFICLNYVCGIWLRHL